MVNRATTISARKPLIDFPLGPAELAWPDIPVVNSGLVQFPTLLDRSLSSAIQDCLLIDVGSEGECYYL